LVSAVAGLFVAAETESACVEHVFNTNKACMVCSTVYCGLPQLHMDAFVSFYSEQSGVFFQSYAVSAQLDWRLPVLAMLHMSPAVSLSLGRRCTCCCFAVCSVRDDCCAGGAERQPQECAHLGGLAAARTAGRVKLWKRALVVEGQPRDCWQSAVLMCHSTPKVLQQRFARAKANAWCVCSVLSRHGVLRETSN
jgi:hypothetical protein